MWRRLACISLLTAATPATPAIGVEAGPTRCAAIKSDPQRLECFDLLYKSNISTAKTGTFRVREETSKVDDSKVVIVMAESVSPVRGRFGRDRPADIVMRCAEKKTDVYFIFAGNFMSSHQHGSVTYRIDKRPAVTRHFTNSNDHQALGLWGGGQAIPFIRSLYGAGNLFIRATPMSESAITADFNIAGIEDATKPLREACGWPAKPAAAPPARVHPTPLPR